MEPNIRATDFHNPDDRRCCEQMLAIAASWRDPEPPTARNPDPHLARYVRDLGRPGDAGVIACIEGETVGAAWYRLFTADEPGYGYVAPDVPEISIAVHRDHRGRGIGTRLLTALIDQARAEGVRRLSLSVERDNPAVRLYRRHGFEPIGESGNSWTMVLCLDVS